MCGLAVATVYYNKTHRYEHEFFIRHLSLASWFYTNQITETFLKQNVCFRRPFLFKFFISTLSSLTEDFGLYAAAYNFKWFRFVLFAGLGYKRRFFRQKRIMFSYIGDRHWILYKFGSFSTVVPTKKRNFIFFSNSKFFFSKDYNFFSSLRKPYVYKMKGFLDRRVKRRFLFVRRIRIRGLKMKLSKKQLML